MIINLQHEHVCRSKRLKMAGRKRRSVINHHLSLSEYNSEWDAEKPQTKGLRSPFKPRGGWIQPHRPAGPSHSQRNLKKCTKYDIIMATASPAKQSYHGRVFVCLFFFTCCTKSPFALQNFLACFVFFSRRKKKKKKKLRIREHKHASRQRHAGEMRMRSRHCTEHRHTKIIRYSPWCEVSVPPRPPPSLENPRLPPLPFIWGEQLNLQVTCGVVEAQEGPRGNPSTL